MKHLKSKISRVLAFYIVICSSVVTLILTGIQLRIDYNDGIDLIHQRIQQIELTNIDSITQSLWTIDQSSVQIQLNGLSRINDVTFVKITDHNNNFVAASGAINTDNIISENIALKKTYRDKDISLGTLTVVATKENIYQKLIDTVIMILITQGIKTFLVSTFILFIFYYLVTRHLEKISQHSEKINLTKKTPALKLDRKDSVYNKDDEFHSLVESINTMSTNIYDSYISLLKNQKKLAEQEAQFSAIFNAMSDTIIFVNLDGIITQTNPAFHTQFGYNQSDLKNKTTLMLYAYPENLTEREQKHYHTNTLPNELESEIEYRRKDNTTFISETAGSAVMLPDGTNIGFIAIIRDISLKKHAEKEKSLLQKQLHQSQKMEAIGQLTGGIAHDFNNILGSILGYSELSIDQIKQLDNPKLLKYIENIAIAGERARELVSKLLTFSRGDPGEPELINLNNLINEVYTLIRPTISSSIIINIEADDRVPDVFMDESQMHQILMNLCLNARDSIKEHGTITIKLSHEKNINTTCQSCKKYIHGEYVQLTVDDTGIGIPPEILDKIFEPFQTTKGIGEGTGLGLSMVHGILHKHNSHVIIETELNQGSRFKLLIPPSSNDKVKTDTVITIQQDTLQDGNGESILIVDDEEDLAIFLQQLLLTHNYNASYITSSKKALESITSDNNHYDLIITDQTMPEMTGIELIKDVFKTNPNTPIILYSGYNEEVNEESAQKMGCVKYFNKPVNNHLLIQTIHDILTSKKSV